MKLAFLLITFTPAFLCLNINNIFENINNNVLILNARAAEIAWETSISPGNPELPEKAAKYQKGRIKWEEETCGTLATLHKGHLMNSSQARQTYLMCRGPKYNFSEARRLSQLYEDLQTIYIEAEICIPSSNNNGVHNIQQIETTILEFLKTVEHLKTERDVDSKMADDFVSLAAKIVNESNEKGYCLKGEEDFEQVMELSKNEAVLKWTWLVWREKVGPPMEEPFQQLVDVENIGARRNGYEDIGASWRDELETPHLRQLCRKLYNDIRPLYLILHGVVRFYLRRFYGEVVPKTGPIPAHLLGNLWSQNWEPLVDLIIPKTIDLDQSIKKLNWTALDMTRKADDFYQSLGLPAMTETFWRKSVFTRENKATRCHGTAADMFKNGDFRLLYCSGTTMEDFYVIHHEMGHIQYYMAYESQPALFRQANTALHESIGDATMYGVMTPQHLHRLGLINDSLLYTSDDNDAVKAVIDEQVELTDEVYNAFAKREGRRESDNNRLISNGNDVVKDKIIINERKVKHNSNFGTFAYRDKESFNTDEIFMLKQALNKLPQIPFSLLLDEYRWKFYEGGLSKGEYNKAFWKMATDLQGIAPSNERGEEYFDIGAKFHVPDNTPYIRYFLSSFLQHQIFEALCKAAVFGQRTTDELPESITLNRCDIYGSKTAGRILKDLMSRGHSQHWREILREVTGDGDISAASLLRYYGPLYEKLLKFVRKYRIPIGWEDATIIGKLYFG